jgi:2-haloalkanoic acid dehalogenase type II
MFSMPTARCSTFMPPSRAGAEADQFSEIWRTKQLEYTWTLTLAGHYVDFWTLTERALDFAFARVASVDRALRPKLLEAYLTLDAFADARSALSDLKARGARLAILSNGSPRMLDAAVQAAGSPNFWTPFFRWTRCGNTSRGRRSMRLSPRPLPSSRAM